MAINETRIIQRAVDYSEAFTTERKRSQTMNFAKFEELLERNVTRNINKSFTQYTKDLLKTYVQNPVANQDTLREISRFLCRNSMLYQKLLMYYASMPLFYYNITQKNDLSKEINVKKSMSDYEKVLEEFEAFNIKKEGYNSIYIALRDGFYVGYMYDSDEEGIFSMPLDVRYCRIYGKTPEGEWIVYFDAAYFDSGNNGEYIEGSDGKGMGAWDDVFIEGYKKYKNDGRDYEWFRLPPEKTFCLISGAEDEFAYPLPFFLPLFLSLIDLLDLEQILASKNELENYKLIINKIPLIHNSDDVDDFAISLDLAQRFNDLMKAIVPDLVGVALSPGFETETIHFEDSNSTKDTDSLSNSINNLFSNAGASQLVVSGGGSSSSIALKHAIENDMANCFIWVHRIESWLNYFIKKNISDGYYLQIYEITWYNRDEFLQRAKDLASLGGSALDFLCANGDTPYMAWQKLRFEAAIGLKDIMQPLKSSYNTSFKNTNNVGRPRSNDDDLSEDGLATRDGNKNGNE